jgi:hypothetical protein
MAADDTVPHATEAQESAYGKLCIAKAHVADAIRVLGKARDELNREHPARHVAIAITEVETGALWVDKALYELTSAVVFPPRTRSR